MDTADTVATRSLTEYPEYSDRLMTEPDTVHTMRQRLGRNIVIDSDTEEEAVARRGSGDPCRAVVTAGRATAPSGVGHAAVGVTVHKRRPTGRNRPHERVTIALVSTVRMIC